MKRVEKKPAGKREAVILFAVGGYTLAIAAHAVEEIRNTGGLKPLPAGTATARLAKFKGTLERDRKRYFVVDSNLHFRLFPSKASRLLVLRGSAAAVLVDHTDRIIEIGAVHALPRAFQGEERQWYRGLAMIDERVVPVVDPAAFMSKAEFTVLQAAVAGAEAAESAPSKKGATA
ncbi:MAG: chemotaxis protein CheW [Acidobacteriota bacterium]|nr:chemotaxis protein CheW [Acidobacteriota bacterium]